MKKRLFSNKKDKNDTDKENNQKDDNQEEENDEEDEFLSLTSIEEIIKPSVDKSFKRS